jgi:PAS domain S-box-containing protein
MRLDSPVLDAIKAKGEHSVQFYEQDSVLINAVCTFVGEGLRHGDGAVLIGTAAHRQAIDEALIDAGVDVAEAKSKGQYVVLDAAETLSSFMMNGSPDEALFKKVVGGVIAKATTLHSRVRAFGEMVALLWAEGNASAAIALEELWNDLGKNYVFSLLCAYPMKGFGNCENAGDFAHICRTHSRVIAAEGYAASTEDESHREVAVLQQKAAALAAEVSRRKETEEKLQKREEAQRMSEERLRQVLAIMPAAVYACDAEGRITFYNEHAVELWGREPSLNDDRFCAAYRCWFGEKLLKPEETPMAVAVREGKAFRDLEPVFERSDGKKMSVLVNIAPLFDDDGKPAGAINVLQDISPIRRAHEELRASEQHLRAVIENTPECVKMVAPDGTLLAINSAGLRVVEANFPEEVIGKSIYNLIAPEYLEAFRTLNERVCAGRTEELEFEIVGLRGTRRWMETHAAPIADVRTGQRVQLAVTRDITDRKRAQEAMARLAAIVESSDDAIISKDLNSIITSWNTGAEKIFGYTREEVIGKPVTLLMPPERLNEEPMIQQRIKNGEAIDHYETVRRRKNGTLLDISLTVSPIRNERGQVVGASKVARDITDRVRAKEKLEQTVAERTAQLRDTVAELEAFSYSVAHDMRAPLRAMNTYSRYLDQDFSEVLPAAGKEFLRKISGGAQRLDSLITDVLNYSKIARSEMPLEKVDIEKLTREIVESYPDLQEKGSTILVQSPIPAVIGNPAALTQCISNLLSNATKFVAAGTTPRVQVRAEKRGNWIRVWVEDNGIGIPEEGRERIFRMFQRLNPAREFEGTGIGLTIVRKSVERMGGQVGVESQVGVGSHFWFELRAAA